MASRPGGVGSVRFGAVTGRHRGQPKDRVADDEVDERSSRKWIGVVAGAFLVPVVVCSVVAFGLREEPAREPGSSSGREAAPKVTQEPTYEQFVAPEQEPQAGTKAPKRTVVPKVTPRKRVVPRPSVTPTWQPCPPGWRDVWWMYRWCVRQHGHRGR
ncbi:hypothetical protein GCM10022254_07010 [Actinomadura meridiana]|uniref:Uncharacterized protein n=1 Tax=Actinomadura meridiana TaxID=559626 RepID=A0ABP8BT25_9ACTN